MCKYLQKVFMILALRGTLSIIHPISTGSTLAPAMPTMSLTQFQFLLTVGKILASLLWPLMTTKNYYGWAIKA